MGRPKSSTLKAAGETGLDSRQIVLAALALLDEVGFDGLTMRSLANALGIKAASLYWHVRDKQELLGLLADELCAPIREPDPDLRWQQRLDALANEYRRVLRAHRDAARVFANGGAPAGPNQLRLAEIVLRALLDAGFSHKDAAYAGLLVNEYVTTFVAEEERWQAGAIEGESEGEKAELEMEAYPSMAAVARYLMVPDMDERFRFGIEILRAGLEARLEKGQA